MPLIDRNSSTPFYIQIYEQVVQGIESGVYPAGKKLPSIRECARELGVSNTTIELAYQKLTEEGYVSARRGSGYTICAVETNKRGLEAKFEDEYCEALNQLRQEDAGQDSRRIAATLQSGAREGSPVFDFAYDTVDPTLFPFTTWARISREVFFGKGAEHVCLYNDAQGLRELREQIANYTSGEYGLTCTAEQVLVMPTTRDLISSIMSLFSPSETTFAMENPGYDEVSAKMEARGYKVVPVSTYPPAAWPDILREIDGADVVFTTPASQFPTNAVMPLDLRKKIVKWAQDSDAYLIDDEYGWEYQSGVSRMPSLAALDSRGHVITIGTFSNSFTPAICLSYAILPPQLMLKWRKAHRGAHPQTPWQTQAAMAMFMSDDYWRTHIRKIRTTMQRKKQLLLDAITHSMGSGASILEGPTNLFVLVNPGNDMSEAELVESAAKANVTVYPTSQYWTNGAPADWRYVLVGFAGIAENAIEPGVQALANAWGLA